jgi:hypothetical protein
MLTFESLTRPPPMSDTSAEVTFDPQTVLWSVNGGYIAATLLRLVTGVAQLKRPGTITVNFLRALAAGPARFELELLHRARGAELHGARLFQGDALRALAQVWLVTDSAGPTHRGARMPLVAQPRELRTIEELLEPGEAPVPAFWDMFEQRPVARNRVAHGQARALRWFRFKGDMSGAGAAACSLPLIDTMGLPAVAQLYPPPFLTTLAPTTLLTVQFHDTTYAGEWLLADARCDYAQDGVLNTGVRVWGEGGGTRCGGPFTDGHEARRGRLRRALIRCAGGEPAAPVVRVV